MYYCISRLCTLGGMSPSSCHFHPSSKSTSEQTPNFTLLKSLQILDLPTLDQRRNTLCLNFAKRCIQNGKMSHLFPINNRNKIHDTRKKQKYNIQFANTERYRKSPVIHMQRLLNEDNENMMSSLQPTG